jgi:hypothetical protein
VQHIEHRPGILLRSHWKEAWLLLTACGSSAPIDTPLPAAVSTPSLPPLLPASTLGCGQPAMPDLHNTCPRTQPQFADDVTNAVLYVIDKRPELFNAKDGGYPDYRVLDHRACTAAVVDRLRAVGYCASDEKEEVAVKRTNAFNEQYNLWTSFGYVRPSYVTTCFPAQF